MSVHVKYPLHNMDIKGKVTIKFVLKIVARKMTQSPEAKGRWERQWVRQVEHWIRGLWSETV